MVLNVKFEENNAVDREQEHQVSGIFLAVDELSIAVEELCAKSDES